MTITKKTLVLKIGENGSRTYEDMDLPITCDYCGVCFEKVEDIRILHHGNCGCPSHNIHQVCKACKDKYSGEEKK